MANNDAIALPRSDIPDQPPSTRLPPTTRIAPLLEQRKDVFCRSNLARQQCRESDADPRSTAQAERLFYLRRAFVPNCVTQPRLHTPERRARTVSLHRWRIGVISSSSCSASMTTRIHDAAKSYSTSSP
ncbi:hypothetical protein FHY12_002579 [Xanthomonas arboricola]|uniref:hypothetical protein n=1 Tax=Xanthomonas euroxanthea TaxID=2259622 RepID=UPI00141B2C90|nr:hypothetical protein [Xanthomonas euroxanthea]NIK40254.1 hypothetical protein [Xanthomonas euroxanthea]